MLADLGLAVVLIPDTVASITPPVLSRVVASCPLLLKSSSTHRAWLRPGRYCAMPFSTNHTFAPSPRPFVLSLFTSQPVSVEPCELSAESCKRIICLYATEDAKAQGEALGGGVLHKRNDGSTLLLHMANPNPDIQVAERAILLPPITRALVRLAPHFTFITWMA
jgi:hypothetical protein